MAKKIELLHTTYDESGNIESQEVVHPLTSPDCIIMENGKTLDEVMGDGIATPTLTHEGTSFKVGVGDSNIEVVDGDVAGMTLKGQSYQNILPKPTTLIMETDEKEFKINDKIDSNIIIDDNIAEIATVKGKTIVNAVQEESGSEYTVLGEDLSGQSIAHVKETPTLEGQTLVNVLDYYNRAVDNSTAPVKNGDTISFTSDNRDYRMVMFWLDHRNPLIKPNTKYIVMYDSVVSELLTTNTVRVFSFKDGINTVLSEGYDSNKKYQVFTTPNEVNLDISLRIHATLDTAMVNTIIVKGLKVFEYQEGMENWDIPYFEGEKYFESNIKGVTLQGQTLVNTIQEPCEDDYVVLGADDGIEISAETGGHGTIEDTVQGRINGAILKGQTLVNLATVTYHDFSQGRTPAYDLSYPMKTGTNYTVFVNITSMDATEVRIRFGKDKQDYLTYKTITTVGLHKFTMTPTIEFNQFCPFIQSDDFNNGRYSIIEKLVILEGDHTQEDIPYFEGMKSVQMPVLKTTGKNLWNFESSIRAGVISFTDVDLELGTYYFSLDVDETFKTSPVVAFVTSTDEVVAYGYADEVNKYEITKDVSYITLYSNGFSYSNSHENITTFSNMFLTKEEHIKSEYEPYKSNILTVNEDVTLRGIGDVKDELDLTTGKLTQRIGEVVLNGSEDWFMVEKFKNNSEYIYCENRAYDNLVKNWGGEILSDKLPKTQLTDFNLNNCPKEEAITSTYDMGNIRLSIKADKLTTVSSQGLQDYLSQNPIKVQYELETPIIHKVDLQVTDQDGNTIPHIQTQPTVTHITASSDYLIPTVTIDNNLTYETIIKPSTLYTVRFKHDTVNADNPLTVDLGGTVQTVTSTEFTITTPSELTHNQLVFSGKNNVVSEVQVIEGDVTNIEYPFFEGMNDVKSPKLLATGKNLFDISKVIKNSNFSTNGNTIVYTATSNLANVSIFTGKAALKTPLGDFEGIKVSPNTEYTLTNESNTNFRIVFNDITKNINNLIQGDGYLFVNNSGTKTFTTPSWCEYIDIKFGGGTVGGEYTISNLQLEESSTATSYEPYKGVEVQQDIDSIPLTSDMFEQGNIASGKIVGMSYQQLSHNTETIRVKSKTLIPIKPNGKYIMQNLNKTNNRLWGWQYDKNGGYLSSIGNTDEIDVFQFDSKAHYITFVLCNQDNSTISPSDLDSMNLILQEVPQEIVLRGIGDVKDELDLTRGEYIQRIGEMILDGSQYWTPSGDHVSNEEYVVYNTAKIEYGISSSRIGIADKLEYSIEAISTNLFSKECVFINNTYQVCYIRIKRSKITNTTIKEYLSKNPITVQYHLETPIIHKVNLTNTKVIQSYATETHYETITPSDSLIPNITIPSTLNYNVAIKPSTEYTIRANTSDNLTVDLGGATGTLLNGKVTLTTPTTLAHNEVKFSGTGKVKELMVVEGNEIKDNVPFFNGMKNVEMGGIKLVNIARGATTSALVTANGNKTQFTYKNTQEVDTGHVLFDRTLLKPNTTYTIYCNITSNTINRQCKIQVGNGIDNFINIPINYTGIIKETLTTTDYISDAMLIYFRSSPTLGQVVIENPMIIEGDWTHLDEIPYIESEMIIEQPIIRSQGKNLFDKNKAINGRWVNNTNGSIVDSPDNFIYMMDVKPNTRYTASFNGTLVNATHWAEYSGVPSSSTFIRFIQASSITTSSTTKKVIALYSCLPEYINKNKDNFQIEESSSATSYEPYKHQTLYSNRVIGYEDGCYYTWDTGTKASAESIASVMSDVEGLNVAYVTHASSNFSFYDKDGVYLSGSMFLSTTTDFDRFGFIKIPANAKYMKMACGNKNSTAAKDYHLKATVTGELPLRSLPNGVCDTLNLVTGEYVQRVGEAVLDGSEDWTQHTASSLEKTHCFSTKLPYKGSLQYSTLLWTDKISNHSVGWANDAERIWINEFDRVTLHLFKNKCNSMNEFKQYLSQNPITVQYELETPIVRKLGFTTKGNYREQVLDGSETWAMDAIDNDKTVRMTKKTVSPLQNALYDTVLFTDDYHVRAKDESHNTYEYITCIGNGIYINIYQSKVSELSVQGCTQWLSQNPIKVGYITSTQSSESYNNIHKPIFFNNVNVQYLPNNVDIQPELTYQVRTKNSYVMDMMKPNTIYTSRMLQSSNGSTFIDGTVVTMKLNNTFTSPSSLTDKLMITPINRQEFMIIEGDVTGKNLPYFKGILSAYHDVDEIEIDSVSKNLFDINNLVRINSASHTTVIGNSITFNCTAPFLGCGDCWIPVEIGENYTISLGQIIGSIGATGARIEVRFYNSLPTPIESSTLPNIIGGALTTRDKIKATAPAQYMRVTISNGQGDVNNEVTITNIQVEKSSSVTSYIPHAHNTTLIEMPTRLETVKVVRPVIENGAINTGTGASYDDGDALVRNVRTKDYLPVQPGEIIKFYNNGQGRAVNIHYYDINKQFIKYEFYDGTSTRPTVPKDCYFVRMYCGKSACSDITLTRQAYKPIQLNSLPNGVCDEIIMKPNSNKAQLVQRVGKVVLDGCDYKFGAYAGEVKGNDVMCKYIPYTDGKNGGLCISDRFLTPTYSNQYTNIETIMFGTNTIIMSIRRARTNSTSIEEYLKDNPITVYYELETPIIHEIQLKGYPHVYENGTVTLNTDTPHQTLVSYNVNQEQLINTQNETIIRHDQQIDDLYYYIEMYLEEIYQMELFRMKLELSL